MTEAEKNKQPTNKKIYEDDNWVIDFVNGNVRVTYFENWHYVDEVIITKEDFFKEDFK